ncbi:MAG: glycosyltransferase family 1 protein [Chthoniobacterales bacterium]|jgi:hypothetical protein|nr:glycosyltransferase family 1 protein [Chthoniobacterales bacterium]
MKVSFFLPPHYMPSIAKREVWLSGKRVIPEQIGKGDTAENWIYQTWNSLHLEGADVQMTDSMPSEGIVVCLAGMLHAGCLPNGRCYMAAVVADGLPHPQAQLHILQNSAHARHSPFSVFIPHWPQPNLIPRAPGRGRKFDRVGFFGDPKNLAAELANPDWQKSLRQQVGVEFVVRWHQHWHDYSDIDAVVAIREFSGSSHIRKPATKLYNAWLAGVPFIGGTDSAYAADGRAGVDYLVAKTPDEVVAHLRKLRVEPEWRQQVVQAGHESGRLFTPEATLKRWRRLVEDELPARATRLRGTRAPLRAIRQALNRAWCLIDLWRPR